MTRIRSPSQLKNMCRPNIIWTIRGICYDDQSIPLNIDIQQLIQNFSQKTLVFYQLLEGTDMRFIRAEP